ncbi:FMN-linked oxidoreductase [Cylindrobasidium torrendii FP15055 ss-10]|uniref:FMN-linked oxidoreductase n=1 Tax=Cylindrobasidium torrendii FP15055 ss-10 TaxID=1314674 RepID=A0A0D7BRP4_9AGAR|nr:FMN-linked oxidoreductase [Cylindrobasidium torrendii FP15055 ss-10]
MTSTSKLFQPIRVGTMPLQHRVVLAPLTRFKATAEHVPHAPLVAEYYSQRAHTPGNLLITEATFIAPRAGGYKNVPGIWNEDQIHAWKEITDAVHAKGSFIYLQLWALGRAADPAVLKEEGDYPYVSASDIPMPGNPVNPRPLTVEEIKEYVGLYAQAARNAVKAGFDGVEIHGANGYILDQFSRECSNKRTDAYGGSIENRLRFPLEVIEAVSAAIGADRTGYRLSPWNAIQGMDTVDAVPVFTALVNAVKERYPKLAYLHIVEPRVLGLYDRKDGTPEGESNDFVRDLLKGTDIPLISAGGYTTESAVETADQKGDLIAFGRYYISNPDIAYRIKAGIAFTKYNRKTFYLPGNVSEGYTDYPFADAEKANL